MSRPDDVPESIWATASATAATIFNRLLDEGRIAVITAAVRDEAAVTIARAVMEVQAEARSEEAQRCAEIATKLKWNPAKPSQNAAVIKQITADWGSKIAAAILADPPGRR